MGGHDRESSVGRWWQHVIEKKWEAVVERGQFSGVVVASCCREKVGSHGSGKWGDVTEKNRRS